MMKKYCLVLFLVIVGCFTPLCGLEYHSLAPDFTHDDVYGVKHQKSDFKKAIIVMEWRNPDCDYSKKHYSTGYLQAIQQEYTKKGVIWFTIISEKPGSKAYMMPQEIKALIKEEKWGGSFFISDEDGEIRKLYGVKRVPMIFVIGPHRRIQYMGAVDHIKSTNPNDLKDAKNYIKQALDTLLEYKYDPDEFPYIYTDVKSPKITESIPYGCGINF